MPLKLALIGLKGHEGVVLAGAKQLGDIELIAVADDVSKNLVAFKKTEKLAAAAQGFDDWRQLFEQTRPDVVCLSDANDLHAAQILVAASKGIDVVTEKPLALTLDDLAKVRAALATSKTRLTALLTMRHEAKYSVVRKLIADGAIGDVAQVTAQKSYRLGTRDAWFKSAARLGGMIPYIGIHPVDLIRWTTGLDFTRVAALAGRAGDFAQLGEGKNAASILAALSNGASATIRLDYLRPETAPTHGDDRLRVVGSRGIVECRGDEPKILLVTDKEGPHKIEPDKPTNLFVEYRRAIDAGKPWPIAAEDALRASEIVLLMRQAAESGAFVDVPKA
ncbi:MAG: Gfo/Idh/MocA family oxidoreductase [Pirellulales bacterium]